MKIKEPKDWKVVKSRVVECIVVGCTSKPWSECICEKHLIDKNQEPRYPGN